jgi:integrase
VSTGSRKRDGIKRERKADGTVRYKVRISWQEGGKQRERCKRFTTFEAARRWQAEKEHHRHRGLKPRPATRRTLNEHLDLWLTGLTVAARTKVDYHKVVARYWRPALGTLRLDQLTTEDVRQVLAEMGERGLSPRTRQQARTILRIALGVAVEDGLLAVNPAVGKRLSVPQVRREMQVLTGAQVGALLDGTRDEPYGALWAVLLTTGIRLGEALGLQWADLASDGAELRVVRALVRPTHGTDWLLESPKTGRTRAVPLLPEAVDALQRHRDRQQVERLVAADGYASYPGGGFIFASERGQPLQGTVVYKYHWRPMLTRLGVPPVRLHDCRHTAATMMLEAGYPMKLVQEILGHASMAITADVYSHILPAYRREAVGALAAHLARARTNHGQTEGEIS